MIRPGNFNGGQDHSLSHRCGNDSDKQKEFQVEYGFVPLEWECFA